MLNQYIFFNHYIIRLQAKLIYFFLSGFSAYKEVIFQKRFKRDSKKGKLHVIYTKSQSSIGDDQVRVKE